MIENKKKNEKSELVAQINVPCSDFTEACFVEKWYTPSPDIRLSSSNLKYSQSSKLVNCPRPEYDELMKNVIDCSPTIRIKGRYRPLQILPTYHYNQLADFLEKQSINLVESLEPHLKVKSKEELVKILLLILEYKECHIEFLSDLVTLEVTKAEDTLILRGNSVASKAIESYMKMVGEKYLTSLLADLINDVILEELDYEVNPLKLNSSKELHAITDKQNKLEKLVENVWNKIYNSSNSVPKDLKLVFSKIREKLSESKRVSSCNALMIDQVISSCLFLRYICPAIMSPFLFGLANEYSDKACINRTLTLVAKSIQSLANFSQSPQSKESYMGFMQRFINKNSNNMRTFLKNISTTTSNGKQSKESEMNNSSPDFDFLNLRRKDEKFIDVGYHLAEFSFHLNIHLKDIPEKKYNDTLKDIRLLIDGITKLNATHDSETDSTSSNISNSCNLRSRIPTLVKKPERNNIDVNYQSLFSKNSISQNTSLENNYKLLPRMKSFDVEENFSYIPIRNTQNKTSSVEKRNQFTGDNYVNFEHCDSIIYDEPCANNSNSIRSLGGTACLNEMEINEGWNKMVKECNNSENTPGEISEECNNYTFNSSGYQSLSNFSPDDFDNLMIHHYGYINNEIFDEKFACSLPNKIRSSTTPSQRNNINRFKKNSPMNTKKSIDNKYLEQNCRESNILLGQGLGSSRETFESLENLSNLNNQSLSGSKSLLSLHQKKPLGNKTNSMAINLDKEISGSYYSSDCSLSSKNRSSSINSQKIHSSVSMNVDLDPLICNEWKRIKLFLEIFNIPKPTHNHGTAIEQYKQRTIDENRLVSFLESKSQINQSDINSYLPAAYRLLKNVHKQGKIPPDVLTKHLLNANKIIQHAYVNQSISRQVSNTSNEIHDTKVSGSSKPKKIDNRREVSHLSVYSKD